MPAAHVDSRDVIVTDKRHTQAAPLLPETYARLAATIPPLAQNSVVVMGGFIGATEDGVTTTLGRGGSDFTAAIVGAGIDAEEIQIWTDVDGMLTADPTILPGGHRVKTISFAEAAELAYFGAKVLHPATVVPAIEKNIPVLILNSRRPEVEGTRIIAEAVHCANVVKSIACKTQDHARQHPLHAHADGARIPAPHLRSLRPLRNAGRHGRDHAKSASRSPSTTLPGSKDISRELRQFAEVSSRRRSGDRLPGRREHPLHAGRGEPRVQRSERHQHPHDLAGSVAVEPQLRGGAGQTCKPAVERLHAEFFRELDRGGLRRHENRASSATARWAS